MPERNEPIRFTVLSEDGGKQTIMLGIATDEQWQAILGNDSSYDHHFIYAVKTTGIFCRPSCKSRPPIRANICIFQNAEHAQKAGFRPCKRCKPSGERMPDQEWVLEIVQCIHSRYAESLTLQSLAEFCHGSPYHLQRTFKRIMGVSPMEYVQRTRMHHAKHLLIHSKYPVADIAQTVGLSNTPYFITLFKKMTGHTPAAYRMREWNIDQDEISGGENNHGN